MFNKEKLKSFISTHGIKQKFISEKTGIEEGKLSKILNGKRKCTADEFIRICSALNVKPEIFIESENL